MKKKKSLVRVISLCLILALMLGGMPVVALDNATAATTTAPADTADRTVTEAALPDAEESLLGPGELSYAALQTAVLAPTDIPDALPAGAVEAKGHVNRVYEQEVGLSHLLFQNRDGGKTAYFYGTPIKYVAADGSVRDKSKTLIAVNKTYGALGYDYGVEDNSFRQYYAQNPATGVLLELGEGSVRIIPQPLGSLVVPRGVLRENTFVYNHIFGNTTALVYTPQLSGVKEDIVLRSFAGVSDFTFTYRTNGLSLIEIDGTYTLVDESGFPQATLGEVVLIDAEGKRAGGSLTVTETANGVYTVTVHADRAFLTNPSTVYPVTVDPNISQTVPSGQTYYQMFDSYNVCATNDYWNNSAHGSNFLLGSLNNTCTGRIVYRMPMFIKGAIPFDYDDLNPHQILSASINIHIEGHRANNIITQPIATAHDLDYHTIDEDLYEACEFYGDLPYNSTTVAGANAMYAIDMTAVVKSWLAYNRGDMDSEFGAYNPSYGMAVLQENESVYAVNGAPMLMHVDEVQYNTFVSLDYGDYGGEYYLNSVETGRFLSVSTDQMPGSLGTFHANTTTKWTVRYCGASTYTIERTGSDGYLYILPAFSSASTRYWSGEGWSDDIRWEIRKEQSYASLWIPYNQMYLSSAYANATPTYSNSTPWRLVPVDEYLKWEEFAVSDMFIAPGTTIPIQLDVPADVSHTAPTDFTWSSSNDDFDISSTGTLVVPQSGGYTTISITHITTGKTVTFVVKSGTIEESVYRIRNDRSSKFMDIGGSSVVQNEIEGDPSQLWDIKLLEDGGYTIQSRSNNLYLAVSGNTGIALVEDGTSSNAKWDIVELPNYNYHIRPYNTANAISVANNSNANGQSLIQISHNNNHAYDEWDFYNNVITIKNYYDKTYLGSELIQYIDDANAFVQHVFEQEFGITIRMEGEAVHMESKADQCNHEADRPCMPDCATSCAGHHKNFYNMHTFVMSLPRENNQISVMWAQRESNTLCDWTDDGEHVLDDMGTIAFTYTGFQPAINIVNIPDGTAEMRKACMAITLAHEVAHVLGMYEIYADPSVEHDAGYTYRCIMEQCEMNYIVDYYNGVLGGSRDGFCDMCKMELRKFLYTAILDKHIPIVTEE